MCGTGNILPGATFWPAPDPASRAFFLHQGASGGHNRRPAADDNEEKRAGWWAARLDRVGDVCALASRARVCVHAFFSLASVLPRQKYHATTLLPCPPLPKTTGRAGVVLSCPSPVPSRTAESEHVRRGTHNAQRQPRQVLGDRPDRRKSNQGQPSPAKATVLPENSSDDLTPYAHLFRPCRLDLLILPMHPTNKRTHAHACTHLGTSARRVQRVWAPLLSSHPGHSELVV